VFFSAAAAGRYSPRNLCNRLFQKSKNSIDILWHSTKTAVHSRASKRKNKETALKRAGRFNKATGSPSSAS
jgi:hypothetical protein